ncbi:hypothetical protein [Peribacillus simplex]|uniref:hypothetical protein n=1 Tax=Peribacillus simplex TaxID=1478 RepID=UPI003D2891FB
MDKVELYLKYRKKSYFLKGILFISLFIIAILVFGPPKYYVVPISSMIIAFGISEFVEYKSWKKDKY